MQNVYVCKEVSEILDVTSSIIKDLGSDVPKEVKDDVKQEICLHFLQKNYYHAAMTISSDEIYNLICRICNQNCNGAIHIANHPMHDPIAALYEYA